MTYLIGRSTPAFVVVLSLILRTINPTLASICLYDPHYKIERLGARSPLRTSSGIVMYRCYLIHHGRIAHAEELMATTLNEAIKQGRVLLVAHPETKDSSGIEIWQQADLQYSDQRHTAESCIISPFLMTGP